MCECGFRGVKLLEPPGKPRNDGKYAKNISEQMCRTGKIVALGKEMVVGR